MKKHLILLTVLFSLSLSSCTSDYNKGYNAGYMDGVKIVQKSEKTASSCTSDYNKGYDAGYTDGAKAVQKAEKTADNNYTMETVTVYGDFTATVRKLIPDYAHDNTTNRAAVVTLFQGGPAVVRLNEEICSEIQEGEIYTFEVAEIEFTVPSHQLYDDMSCDFDLLDDLYISGFRIPAEEEYGLECWRVKYK